MSAKQEKKLRKIYRKDLSVKMKDVFEYFVKQKPWYIPKKLWLYWITK